MSAPSLRLVGERRRCVDCGLWLDDATTGPVCADFDACYGAQLVRHIRRRVLRVRPTGYRRGRAWDVDYCSMTGALAVLSPGRYLALYATPNWEGEPLPLQLVDEAGRAASLPAAAVSWSGDLDEDCTVWVRIISDTIAAIGLVAANSHGARV